MKVFFTFFTIISIQNIDTYVQYTNTIELLFIQFLHNV